MASSYKGKIFMFTLLLLFNASLVSSSESVVVEDNQEIEQKYEHGDALDALKRHQLQLDKLEELVKNLSLLITRLESRFLEYPKVKNLENGKLGSEGIKQVVFDEKKRIESDGVVGSLESKAVDGERMGGAVAVPKYSPFWLERFQFISAVKLGSDATSINVLPFRDAEGMSKYVAIGDDHGEVHVLFRNGEILVDFQTLLSSPITAFVSYLSLFKNESVVITGHKNGGILIHRIWEVIEPNGDNKAVLHMETVGKFASPEIEEGGCLITSLEVHHVGRNRYILSTDGSGRLRVFKENGTIHGSAVPKSRPLAFLKQRLLFLSETGAGSLDLRNMKIRESECEGLNNSIAKSYVFDATERSKAYGVTSDGDLIHVLLLGDNMNFKCRVRSKKKLEMAEPLSFQVIKGYLMIANQERIILYNVSSQHYVRSGGPRLLFSAALDEIVAAFVNYQSMELNDYIRKVIPLVGSDQEKLVILGLGSGYLGIYRSNLPVLNNDFNTMHWTSPVIFFIIFLFGAYYFFAKKKDALTSWGPDDPFNASVTTGAPSTSDQGDRSYADASRNADIMDLRGSSLRGPSGRYVSPSRYPGGTSGTYRTSSADTNSRPSSVDPNFRSTSELTGTYRTSSADTNSRPSSVDPNFRTTPELAGAFRTSSADTSSRPSSVDPNFRTTPELTGAFRTSSADTGSRPSSVDPNFRTTSELKYRGSNLETSSFPKRRESLFVNSQITDDGK